MYAHQSQSQWYRQNYPQDLQRDWLASYVQQLQNNRRVDPLAFHPTQQSRTAPPQRASTTQYDNRQPAEYPYRGGRSYFPPYASRSWNGEGSSSYDTEGLDVDEDEDEEGEDGDLTEAETVRDHAHESASLYNADVESILDDASWISDNYDSDSDESLGIATPVEPPKPLPTTSSSKKPTQHRIWLPSGFVPPPLPPPTQPQPRTTFSPPPTTPQMKIGRSVTNTKRASPKHINETVATPQKTAAISINSDKHVRFVSPPLTASVTEECEVLNESPISDRLSIFGQSTEEMDIHVDVDEPSDDDSTVVSPLASPPYRTNYLGLYVHDTFFDDSLSGSTMLDADEVEVPDSHVAAVEGSQANSELLVEQYLRRSSSSDVLTRVMGRMAHLDLSGQIAYDLQNPLKKSLGGCADVFQGHYFSNRKKVAIKRIRVHLDEKKDDAPIIAKEMRIWSSLQHANILSFRGYMMDGDYPMFVSDWMENGTLYDYKHNLSKAEALRMVEGISRGLSYLHSRGVIHSDLKTENVLVSPLGEALLTDFGVSRMIESTLSFGRSSTIKGGTLRWMAPELFPDIDEDEDDGHCPSHSKFTDIWAFGMTVYELVTLKIPYHSIKNDVQVLQVLSKGRLPEKPEFSQNVPDSLVDRYMWLICRRCWSRDPEGRPSMSCLEQELEEIVNTSDYDARGAKLLAAIS